MKGLSFEEGPHLYRLDGDVLPSVTQIMRPLSDTKYNGVSRKTLDQAAERGTIIHQAAQTWAEYGFMDCPPDLQGYFDGFLDWYRTADPKVAGTEVQLYHPLMLYAGTADLIAEIDGQLSLVDYKTTQTISDMLCRVQLEAYSQALLCFGVKVERKMIVQLRAGKPANVKEYAPRDAEAWKVFGALKTVYDYIRTNK